MPPTSVWSATEDWILWLDKNEEVDTSYMTTCGISISMTLYCLFI
ncbi:hypothetical protein ACFTQL_18100 [Peribacillus butanolivorans]